MVEHGEIGYLEWASTRGGGTAMCKSTSTVTGEATEDAEIREEQARDARRWRDMSRESEQGQESHVRH